MLTWTWLLIASALYSIGFGPIEAGLLALFFDWVFRLWFRETFVVEKVDKKEIVIPTKDEMNQISIKWDKKSHMPRETRVTESPEYLARYMPKA
jgi:hypothetical protein